MRLLLVVLYSTINITYDCVCICMCMYTYIYIYTHMLIHALCMPPLSFERPSRAARKKQQGKGTSVGRRIISLSLSLSLCIYNIYIYIYIYMSVYIHTYVCIYIYIYIHICISLSLSIYIYIYISVCIYIYIYVFHVAVYPCLYLMSLYVLCYQCACVTVLMVGLLSWVVSSFFLWCFSYVVSLFFSLSFFLLSLCLRDCVGLFFATANLHTKNSQTKNL